jgi:DNA-binding response OmpR family regulator
MKVLLIDERSDTLDFFGESINNFGYKTGIAQGRDEILPMLSDGNFDVILTNGGSRGLDIVNQIKEKIPSVFVICMKGSQKDESGLNGGADLYLQRPFRSSRLRQAIEDQLFH